MSSHLKLHSLKKIEEVDLTDPNLYSEGPPHQIWKALRNDKPLHWQSVRGELGFWSITKYVDVVNVLKDFKTFTSEKGTLLNLLGTDDPAGGQQLAVTDPPRHTQLKRPLRRVFHSKSIQKHEKDIRSEVLKIINPLKEGGEIDLAKSSEYLSTSVAALLLELPTEDWAHINKITTMAVAPNDDRYKLPDGSKATLDAAHREIFMYFQDIVNYKRIHPSDDPISNLIELEIDGERLSTGAIISNCYSLLLGATVTTPHVINSSILELIESDSYKDWVLHKESLESGLEEALRWSSPASHFMRYATKDVVLRDTLIKKGDAVVVWIGAANFDEDIFENPYHFNFVRNPNPHISFGSGPHYCIGHSLARTSLSIFFREMLAHFNQLEKTGEIEYLSSNFISGIKRFPIRGFR